MSYETPDTKGIVAELTEIIKRHGTQEFSAAKKRFSSGNLAGAEEAFIGRLAESLANSLLDGLVQISVEQITDTKEYADALSKGVREFTLDLSKDLPPLMAYVEFVFKYGSLELLPAVKYEFKLDSTIDAKNIKAVIEERKIQSVHFGTVVVDVTLSVIVNGLDVTIGTFERQLELNYQWNVNGDSEAGTINAPTHTTEGPAYCRKCGHPLTPNAKYCTHCGSMIE